MRLSIEEQLEVIMREKGNICSFYRHIKPSLPASTRKLYEQKPDGDDQLIQLLGEIAVVVNGNFVLKPELCGIYRCIQGRR